MNQEIKKKWVEALRGEKYQQTKKRLRDESGYCCLGVLCEVLQGKIEGFQWQEGQASYKGESNKLDLPSTLNEEIGLPGMYEDALVSMNDSGKTFNKIADWIEENL